MRAAALTLIPIIGTTIALAASADPALGGGPDLINSATGWWIPDETGVRRWGTVSGTTAYSIAVFSCNVGTSNLPWNGFTDQHPVLAQNIYRLHAGRFEQIGAAPVKHVVATVPQDLFCGTCNWPGSFELGVGCSDPYDATRNGEQDRIGPRREIDPVTGVVPYPFTGLGQVGGVLEKRVRVDNDDLDPTNYPGARFFVEGQFVSEADTLAGNAMNNSGYREVMLGPVVDGGWELIPADDVVAETPALFAWMAADPGVAVETVDVPGDGRYSVGSRATDNGNGTWHYEYAVLNYNSGRAARGVSVPVGGCAVTSPEFHDVDVDPIEGTDGTDWPVTIGGGAVSWSTDDFAVNPDANALRWSTVYTMRFDAACGPESGAITITLFQPGPSSTIAVGAVVPAAAACAADLDGSGSVGFSDVLQVIGAWGPCGAPCPEDLSGNAVVDFADILAVLAAWGPC